MAKGAKAKEVITKKVLDTFENSFQYEKEIRIPIEEDGELIQIKCVLTCAKVNVEPNGDVALPGETRMASEINFEDLEPKKIAHQEVTQEEKDNIRKLMESLGL